MGTQFSKIKVTQRVELHGDVFNHADGDYDVEELPDLFTRRAHHSGVLSGHELLSYSFLGGQACEPRRSLRRRHRSKSLYSSFRSNASSRLVLSSDKDLVASAVSTSALQNDLDGLCSKADRGSPPDSELDSGISINVTYEDAQRYNGDNGHHKRLLGRRISSEKLTDGLKSEPRRLSPVPSSSHEIRALAETSSSSLPSSELTLDKEELPNITQGLKRHYREFFSDWFEPGSQLVRCSADGTAGSAFRRRSSRKKNLHQKLVLSQMNTKKAAKLDMDDRAKMIQYFTRPSDIDAVESVRIEDMFGTSCWSVPRAGPAVPTVITVQAPAGIGKSSMLKYMCMKWGCDELWAANFDVLIFVECRTLNRLGNMTGKQFLSQLLQPVADKVALEEEAMADPQQNLIDELARRAAAGRVLLLLDGLDEVHGVGQLSVIRPPAGHPDRPGQPGKGAADANLSPLEFAQCLLTGALLQGTHVIVTSRPHTLSHLQSAKWFLSLPKRMVSLDIQGLSEEGVQSFIHSYVDARLHPEQLAYHPHHHHEEEHPCNEECPCQPLQKRARKDPYIFSLATNPFYLWLICTIFSEAGEDFIPKTLTQLYTWVMLVFANRWQNTSLQMTTSLDSSTVHFLLGFARLCYHLVRSGNIKMTAIQEESLGVLTFPDLAGVSIDQDRAETFGLMTIDRAGAELECEFRHLSLAEYLTALHVHVTGESLKGFPRDRKELILQYLSGLASASQAKDQLVVKEFLSGLGSSAERNDAVEYLKQIQKMKGEWYNQQGLQKQLLFMRCAFESRQEKLSLFPFPGLKVINIRGCALLALDLIIIGNFVSHLADHNRLLELGLRDYPLDRAGLFGLLPCLPLVRTATLCAKKLSQPDCYYALANELRDNPRSRLRELWLLEVPPANMDLDEPDELGAALLDLKEVCRLTNVRVNV